MDSDYVDVHAAADRSRRCTAARLVFQRKGFSYGSKTQSFHTGIDYCSKTSLCGPASIAKYVAQHQHSMHLRIQQAKQMLIMSNTANLLDPSSSNSSTSNSSNSSNSNTMNTTNTSIASSPGSSPHHQPIPRCENDTLSFLNEGRPDLLSTFCNDVLMCQSAEDHAMITLKENVLNSCRRAIEYVNGLHDSLNKTSVKAFCNVARSAYNDLDQEQMRRDATLLQNRYVCVTDTAMGTTTTNMLKGFDISSRAHSIDWCREHIGHPGCDQAIKADSKHLPKETTDADHPTSFKDELDDMGEWKTNMCKVMMRGPVNFLPPMCHAVAKANQVHTDPERRKVCFGAYADCMHDPKTLHVDCKSSKDVCLTKVVE